MRSWTKSFWLNKYSHLTYLNQINYVYISLLLALIFQKIYHYGLSRLCPKDEPDYQVHQKNFNKIFLIVLSYDHKIKPASLKNLTKIMFSHINLSALRNTFI